jgi:hypothetical protein
LYQRAVGCDLERSSSCTDSQNAGLLVLEKEGGLVELQSARQRAEALLILLLYYSFLYIFARLCMTRENSPVAQLLDDAQRRWIRATTGEDLSAVETLLREAIAERGRTAKEQKHRKLARTRLILLLLQDGAGEAQDEACALLHADGYLLQLHQRCLTYGGANFSPFAESCSGEHGPGHACAHTAPVFTIDDALPPPLLECLQHAFSPDSQFWQDHCYDHPETG